MTFTIDTGADDKPLYYSTMAMVIDQLPDGASQDDIDSAFAAMVCAEIARPKKLETARKALCWHWANIAPLAERYPERFDQIMEAFAEKLNAP